MAAHSLFLRRQRQLQQQQQQTPKTEEEKKAEEKQKKQQLKKQQQEKRLFELNHTRIVRLRWKESDGTPATAGPGCYFGLVDGKERKLSLDCGKGLKGFWLMRQLQDGDVVLASLLCPNRFLRMKDGILEFNSGENGPWSRWLVIDGETGEKVTGNIMETLSNGKKIKLGSKSSRGKFIGLKPAEEDKSEVCSSEEGITFTLEAVENLKGVQVVRLCCSALSLVDPKVEEKEKKEEQEKKEKKQQEQKEKKEQIEKKKQEIKELMEKKRQEKKERIEKEKKERIEKKQQEKREKQQQAKELSGSDSE